ncbi:MAG: ribonuclease III [Actinobacteria bacterium RBG_16_64_13]|nr:MAG: ribonuclease III [Actinobacteria bacterium RBG_16_64_13]
MALVEQLPSGLRRIALTHSSWVDARTDSYERLEFLGDSVLGLAIASTLCGQYPEYEEGDLARLKAFVVSRASCAQVAERLGVRELILERAPAPEHKRREAVCNQTILGNVLEALIGAIYLTHGFEQARLAVVDAFEEQMRYAVTAHVDHKTALQELLALRGLQPVYRLVNEIGPPHARVFTSEVVVNGAPRGQGTGTTIKMSEQMAAGEALASLSSKDPVD